MIDDIDASGSTLRALVAEAIRGWETPGVLGLLEDDDLIVRTAAAREVQFRGGLVAFRRLLELSKSDNPYTREISAFALGQFGYPVLPFKNETLPVLEGLLNDESPDVRSAAAAACGHLCFDSMPHHIEERLMDLCLDVDKEVRACAAYSLGNSSGNDFVKTRLHELLSQKYVGGYARLGLDIIDDRKK